MFSYRVCPSKTVPVCPTFCPLYHFVPPSVLFITLSHLLSSLSREFLQEPHFLKHFLQAVLTSCQFNTVPYPELQIKHHNQSSA
ncbi:unnamed protein product [Sympodiomycopsis kandeliae]